MSEWAYVPSYIFATMVAWYAYQLGSTSENAALPLLPWLPIFEQAFSKLFGLVDLLQPAAVIWIGADALVEVSTVALLAVALHEAYKSRVPSLVSKPSPSVVPSAIDHGSLPPSLAPDEIAHARMTINVHERSLRESHNARIAMIVMICLVLLAVVHL
jgi:hypothetical protein